MEECIYFLYWCCKSPFISPLDSPEVQPRFVKGSKRYGRRSAPEFIHTHADSHTQAEDEEEKDEDAQESDDRTVPRKREVTDTHMTNREA